MPKMNGRQVFDAIKYLKPDCGIVICSGYEKQTGLTEFIEREELPPVTKPFELHKLLSVLRQVIDDGNADDSEQIECLAEISCRTDQALCFSSPIVSSGACRSCAAWRADGPNEHMHWVCAAPLGCR